MDIKTIEEMEWRELVECASNELDPHRLSELLDQLLDQLAARRQVLHSQNQNSAGVEPRGWRKSSSSGKRIVLVWVGTRKEMVTFARNCRGQI
jgi:hypothetical protein